MRILHCSRVSPGPLAPDFTPALWSRTREPREAQRAGRLDFRAAEDVRSGTGRGAMLPPVCIVYTAAAADFASQFCRSEIRGAESERRAAATMLPYIHLGPLTLGTYGLMLATALLCGFFVLRADLNRRRLAANPETIIGLVGLAGLVGAKLWHVLESPADFANPLQRIFSSSGFAFYGSFLAGFLMLALLARHYRMPLLVMLDVAAPAAALGYGIGRIGCLISGDGDYGIPTTLPWGMSFPNGIVPTTERVHPTPIYEFLAAVVIFVYLWRLGARSPRKPMPPGGVFARHPVLTGAPRLFVAVIWTQPPLPLRTR